MTYQIDTSVAYAVYRHFDQEGRLLYVGMTKDIAKRRSQHSHSSLWFGVSVRETVEWYSDHASASTAETLAISTEAPIHNAKMGRPPIDNPRTVARHIRLTPDEDALITAAAERAGGQNIADWMRTKLIAAAKRAR